MVAWLGFGLPVCRPPTVGCHNPIARAARGSAILSPCAVTPSVGRAGHGVWRSLVARFVRDEEAAGSNPVTPTSWLEGSDLRKRGQGPTAFQASGHNWGITNRALGSLPYRCAQMSTHSGNSSLPTGSSGSSPCASRTCRRVRRQEESVAVRRPAVRQALESRAIGRWEVSRARAFSGSSRPWWRPHASPSRGRYRSPTLPTPWQRVDSACHS